MLTKNIGYAYASSDIAQHMGYTKTGCWFLAVYEDNKPMSKDDVVSASYDKEVLESVAKDYPLPYGAYSMALVYPPE